MFWGEQRTKRKEEQAALKLRREEAAPEVFLPDWLQELQYFDRNGKHKQNVLKHSCCTDPHNYKPNQTEPFSLGICAPLTSTTKDPGQRLTFFLTWVLGHKFWDTSKKLSADPWDPCPLGYLHTWEKVFISAVKKMSQKWPLMSVILKIPFLFLFEHFRTFGSYSLLPLPLLTDPLCLSTR